MNNLKVIFEDILLSPSNVNKIAILLKCLINETLKNRQDALIYLRKILKFYILKKQMLKFKDLQTLEIKETENFVDCQKFLLNKLIAFFEIIKSQILSKKFEKEIRLLNFQTLIELARYHVDSLENQNTNDIDYFSKEYFFRQTIQILYNLVKNCKTKLKNNVFVNIIFEYCEMYYDFANSLLSYILQEIQNNSEDQQFQKFAYELMESLSIFENYDMKSTLCKQQQQEKTQDEIKEQENRKIQLQQRYQQIIQILIKNLKQNKVLQTRILLKLPTKLFPKFNNQLILSDFLINLFEKSTSQDIQILSLNALFQLILRYQLDYPNFYDKLYQLLSYQSISPNSIFLNKFSTKFMKILENSMKSSKLSSKLTAAFLKSYLAITKTCAKNANSYFLVNCCSKSQYYEKVKIIFQKLFQRNELLLKMLESKKAIKQFDGFDNDIATLTETKGENSYLWELQSLSKFYQFFITALCFSHYSFSFIELLKFFQIKLKNFQPRNLDQFSAQSYDEFIEKQFLKCKQVIFQAPLQKCLELENILEDKSSLFDKNLN